MGYSSLFNCSGPHYIKRFAHYQAQKHTLISFFVDLTLPMRIMGYGYLNIKRLDKNLGDKKLSLIKSWVVSVQI